MHTPRQDETSEDIAIGKKYSEKKELMIVKKAAVKL